MTSGPSSTFAIQWKRVQQERAARPYDLSAQLQPILFLCHFELYDRAAKMLVGLDSIVQDSRLEYLKALIELRAGRLSAAAALSQTLATRFPDFDSGRFLDVEAYLLNTGNLASRSNAKKLRGRLDGLPTGPSYFAIWADLLIKLSSIHGDWGHKIAKEYLSAMLDKESREHVIATLGLSLSKVKLSDLRGRLQSSEPESMQEAVILNVIAHSIYKQGNSEKAIAEFSELQALCPRRVAINRFYIGALTRWARDYFDNNALETALAFIDTCRRNQPLETIHLLNRAAVITRQVVSPNKYHEAWNDVVDHIYRLALTDAARRQDLELAAKVHRLFVYQVEGPTGSELASESVLNAKWLHERQMSASPRHDDTAKAVDNEAIGRDPALLRQWIHNRSAELLIHHWLITIDDADALMTGIGPEEIALNHECRRTFARSLELISLEVGDALAQKLLTDIRSRALTSRARYTAPDVQLGTPAATLLVEHISTMGILDLLASWWRPKFEHLSIAEELIKFIHANGQFIDGRVMWQLRNTRALGEDPSIQLAINFAKGVLPYHEASASFTLAQRRRLAGCLVCKLLEGMAYACMEAHEKDANSTNLKTLERALSFADRACEADAESPTAELVRVRLLLALGFHAEVEQAAKRCIVLAADSPDTVGKSHEYLDLALSRHSKHGSRTVRVRGTSTREHTESKLPTRLEQLRIETSTEPDNLRHHYDIVRLHCMQGEYDQAVRYANKVEAGKLGPNVSFGATWLASLAEGLKSLSIRRRLACLLFLSGARTSSLRLLCDLAEEDGGITFPIAVVNAHVLLEMHQCDAAKECLEQALEKTERMTIRSKKFFRSAFVDIDKAYLHVVTRHIDIAVARYQPDAAAKILLSMLPNLRRKETALLRCAQLLFSIGPNTHHRAALEHALIGHLQMVLPPLLRNRLTGDRDLNNRAFLISTVLLEHCHQLGSFDSSLNEEMRCLASILEEQELGDARDGPECGGLGTRIKQRHVMSSDDKQTEEGPIALRSDSHVAVDTQSIYADLRVSPFESLEAIKAKAKKERNAVEKMKKRKISRKDDARAESRREQRLNEILGQLQNDEARRRYDAINPQGTLLLIQCPPHGEPWSRTKSALGVSLWLAEALGEEACLPIFSDRAGWFTAGH